MGHQLICLVFYTAPVAAFTYLWVNECYWGAVLTAAFFTCTIKIGGDKNA